MLRLQLAQQRPGSVLQACHHHRQHRPPHAEDPKAKEMEKRANELFTLALVPLEKYIEKNPNEKSILDILYKTNTKLGRIEKGQEYKKRLEALKQQ
jgi:hypothetical protein